MHGKLTVSSWYRRLWLVGVRNIARARGSITMEPRYEEHLSELKRVMAEEGLSEYDVAEFLGTSQPTVNRWLRGKVKKMRAQHLFLLRQWLEARQGGGEGRSGAAEHGRGAPDAFPSSPGLRDFMAGLIQMMGGATVGAMARAKEEEFLSDPDMEAKELVRARSATWSPEGLGKLLRRWQIDVADVPGLTRFNRELLLLAYDEAHLTSRYCPLLNLGAAGDWASVRPGLVPRDLRTGTVEAPMDDRRYLAFRANARFGGGMAGTHVEAGDILFCEWMKSAGRHTDLVVCGVRGRDRAHFGEYHFVKGTEFVDLTGLQSSDPERVASSDVVWVCPVVRLERMLGQPTGHRRRWDIGPLPSSVRLG